MKQKPKTKLVHIGFVKRYRRDDLERTSALFVKKPSLDNLDRFLGYLDTVRVFAEVPVGRGRK